VKISFEARKMRRFVPDTHELRTFEAGAPSCSMRPRTMVLDLSAETHCDCM